MQMQSSPEHGCHTCAPCSLRAQRRLRSCLGWRVRLRRWLRGVSWTYRLQPDAAGLKHVTHGATFRHHSWAPCHFGARRLSPACGEILPSSADGRSDMTVQSSYRHLKAARGATVADWLGLLVLLALAFV